MVEKIRNILTITGKDLVVRQPTVSTPGLENLLSGLRWTFRTQDAIGSDGSSAAYNLVLGWEKPYPETTGYLVPTLYNCSDFLEERGYDGLALECDERAGRMVNWLLDQQLPSGGFPAGTGTGNTEPSVFNTGQILLGLCAYEERNGSSGSLERQIADACEWLVDVQNADGSWSQYDYNSVSHAYSSRIAWPMLVSARTIGLDDSIVDAAIDNLDWVVSQQQANSWFERAGFEPGNHPYLHTIAYTVRGLLESGIILKEQKYVDSATAAADRLLEIQERDGHLKGEYDENWTGGSYYCLTGNAQIGVVWGRLHQYTGREDYIDGVDESVSLLSSLQSRTKSTSVDGAIKGSHPIWGSYMYFRYPNWATKFYLDALFEYERHFPLTEADANREITFDSPTRS